MNNNLIYLLADEGPCNIMEVLLINPIMIMIMIIMIIISIIIIIFSSVLWHFLE